MITIRLATASDAGAVAAIIGEGFASYRAWAPADWTPPAVGEGDPGGFAKALANADVWFMVAESGGSVLGHVALALSTHEDPGPPPPGTVFLWQLFVCTASHGGGVASGLMRAALAEAQHLGFSHMLLWTLEGAARARRFYEREGWTVTGRVHRDSGFGLPTVEIQPRHPLTRVSLGVAHRREGCEHQPPRAAPDPLLDVVWLAFPIG